MIAREMPGERLARQGAVTGADPYRTVSPTTRPRARRCRSSSYRQAACRDRPADAARAPVRQPRSKASRSRSSASAAWSSSKALLADGLPSRGRPVRRCHSCPRLVARTAVPGARRRSWLRWRAVPGCLLRAATAVRALWGLPRSRTVRSSPIAVVGYRTAGTAQCRDASNAVLVAPWFQGTSGQLAWQIGPGKLVDTSKYFVIMVDALGNGVSSSPSTSARQPGAAFPIHHRRHRRVAALAGDPDAGARASSRGRRYLDGRHAGLRVGRRPSAVHGQGRLDRRVTADPA